MDGELSLIYRGAEAVLYRGIYAGVEAVYKYRRPKKYRHPALDERIRSLRTVREARALLEAREAGVPVPAVLLVEPEEALLVMEYVEGMLLRDLAERISGQSLLGLFHRLGGIVARMHRAGIMHGDLTTSNIIVLPEGGLVLVDFGLSTRSHRLEDKGVDIHVLLRSLESTVPRAATQAYRAFLKGYGEEAGPEEARSLEEKVEEIRLRGRYVEERRRKWSSTS